MPQANKRKITCAFCPNVLSHPTYGGYYCSPDCQSKGEKFYGGFETKVDTLTAFLQLEKVSDAALEILKQRHGSIIPKQSNSELLELFTEVLERI